MSDPKHRVSTAGTIASAIIWVMIAAVVLMPLGIWLIRGALGLW